MSNLIKILLFQCLPTYINKQLALAKSIKNKTIDKTGTGKNKVIENINFFNKDKLKTKHALISLSPSAWLIAQAEYPNIKYFNLTGFTFEIVKSLNENGYLIDIVDLYSKTFVPSKKYDLYIGHGGKCKVILENLKKDVKVIQYTAGAHWREFNRESQERYDNFCKRKSLAQQKTFKRSLDGLVEGEEYLISKAHIVLAANYPRSNNTYGKYKSKFFFIGWAAYLNDLMKVDISVKNFEEGRKHFIYVGGTGGNIQKGMDLLIETFVKCPELHLYIYCNVEDEIYKHYKPELKLKNIHYIYHYRFKPFHKKLKKILQKINFTIHAPINTGTGTAFIGSMGVGLIPVGYIDLIAPNDSCVLTDSWQIDDLVKCVKEASSKSPEWCKNASELTVKNHQENWSVEIFRNKFNELIRKIDDVPYLSE